MHRRTAQAAGLSVALHLALLAALLVLRPHESAGPGRVSIIEAELLFDTGTWTSAANVDGPGQSNANPPVAPAPEPIEPADADSPPQADATVADIAEPAADSDTIADAAPSAVAAEPEPVDSSADVPSGTPEAVASAEPESSADRADAALDAAAASETAAPSEPMPSAAAEASTTQVAASDAVAPSTQSPDGAPDGSTTPGVLLQSRERQMLAKRFSSWTGSFKPTDGEPTVAWKQDGRAYTAVFRKIPSADPMGIEHMTVDVSTEQGGKRMSTQLTMTRLAFSNFAQFVDQWDPAVQIHDDEIDGRFHSNTEIKLLSSHGTAPVFRGKVTIASHDISTESTGAFSRRKVFPEGLEMGVRRIVLPARFLPFLNEAAKGTDAVQRFERSARITFYPDGTYGWSYLEDGAAEQRRTVSEPAHYLIGLEGATLRIKGSVNGKVLVYATERIVIENDVRYAHARGSHDGDDYLGLVAERTVEIAEPDVTGPGDLEVDASIYARRQFAVRDYYSRESGTLLIYGSLTAGSITATEPRFATKVEFDRRLENARPPSFPLTDRYELESWNGEWSVEEPAAPEQ